jgi:hypothetical protein
MKKRNMILTILIAACFGNAAQAGGVKSGSPDAEVVTDTQGAEKIDEANALLQRLAEIGALDVDENENVKVKKSVLDELRKQGRVKEIQARAGIVCD